MSDKVESSRDWSVLQPGRPSAHPSRLSALVTGEPVNVFITGGRWEHHYRKQRNLPTISIYYHRPRLGPTTLLTFIAQIIIIFSFSAPRSQPEPLVKSVQMMLVNNSNKVKLVCRVKSRDTQTVISWRKDGEAVEEKAGKIRIRERR